MNFGFLNLMQNLHDMTDQESWQGEISLAIAADELGYDSISSVEHHFFDYGMCPDNIQYLSYLAPLTKRARLFPGAVILPWNDPLRVAEKMAVLEYLAPGRVGLGIGRGLSKREYAPFGIDMNTSRERFEESAKMILKALDTGIIEGDGPYYKVPATEIRPKPVRGYSSPEDLFCVAMSADSAISAAELGGRMMTFIQYPIERHLPTINLYRERYREVQGSEPPDPILTDATVCHEDPEEAKRLAYKYIGNHFIAVMNHYEFAGDHFKNIKGYEGYQAAANMIQEAGMEETMHNYIEAQLWGTPEQIIEKYRERFGIVGNYSAMIETSFGGMPFEQAHHSLRLIAEKVMPVFRKMQFATTAAVA